jgi:hypothetical protein
MSVRTSSWRRSAASSHSHAGDGRHDNHVAKNGSWLALQDPRVDKVNHRASGGSQRVYEAPSALKRRVTLGFFA